MAAANKVAPATENETAVLAGKLEVVGPSCFGGNGHWVCLTHPDDGPMNRYRNQFQKDMHISDDGQHTLAWLCHEHGLEVP